MKKRGRLLARGSQSVRHRLAFRTTVIIFSFVAIVSGGIVFLLSLSDSKQAVAATSLPVTLTSFNGSLTDNRAHLKWTTATEVENDYFTVERSSDAVNFLEIGRIKGNGTSSLRHDYTFEDTQTPSGITYYRLSQMNHEGTVSLYGPIAVHKSATGKLNLEASAYPNPFKESFQLTFTSQAIQQVTVTILSINGKVTEMKELTAKKGLNQLDINPSLDIPQGPYLVRILTDSGDVQFLKILHQ